MYQRILVPVDGSGTSARGLEEAIKIGKLSGARLKLLHLVEQLLYAPGLYAEVLPLMREEGERVLAQARAQVEAAGLAVETKLLETQGVRLAEFVNNEARAWPAELIVIGTHGRRGISRLLLGSDAEQVLRLADTPVLLVRGQDEPAAA
ncbi:universal stress protein [Paucibacter sp. R3-3]|uniref:Universal stress protein n=1 Tax=Roseateles agri TaxID=3098619 RepID=A0ABU5DM24_9BURK|nr:universal stress protein [Paucibacter sp. R3-3]MDY0747353.1 universal stress protein [Paucibacter sp. R3-3]